MPNKAILLSEQQVFLKSFFVLPFYFDKGPGHGTSKPIALW
jgi:hypothetical protein